MTRIEWPQTWSPLREAVAALVVAVLAYAVGLGVVGLVLLMSGDQGNSYFLGGVATGVIIGWWAHGSPRRRK